MDKYLVFCRSYLRLALELDPIRLGLEEQTMYSKMTVESFEKPSIDKVMKSNDMVFGKPMIDPDNTRE